MTTPSPKPLGRLPRLAAVTLLASLVCHPPTPASAGDCDQATFVLTGSSSTTGTSGNTRTFAAGGVSVNVTAFSRTKDTGSWQAAYLGAYDYGLGVTDTSESGADPGHTVDNSGRLNFVLFEFSTPVIVDTTYLGYVSGDSDLTAFIGTFADPYQNHLTLSDAILGGCSTEDNTGGGDARWADLNAGSVPSNVLVIAARVTDSGDYFKIKKLTVCVPSAPTYDYGDLPVADTDFNTDGGGVPDQAPRHQRGGTLVLGATCDAEGNGQPSAAASGDDVAGTPDDEEGVAFGSLTAGASGTITVTVTGSGGKLNAWIDWNGDNHFEVEEQVASNAAMNSGANLLPVSVPEDAVTLSNLAARFRLSSAGDDAPTSGTAADGEIEDHLVVVLPADSDCLTTTFTLTGDSSTDGTDGNIRSFTASGVSVKASAFSRTKSAATWAPAFLGAFSLGLGVTDSGETGDSNTHTVDNDGRLNFVLFEFSTPVIVDKTYLGYVSNDSDLTAWIGMFSDPYNNHLTLSDAHLGSCSTTEDSAGGSSTRWADLNAGQVAGNVLVIAADPDDTYDYFKIKLLTVCVPTVPSYDFGDLPADGTTFFTDGGGTPADAPRHVVGGGLMLGTDCDAEDNGVPSDDADADDNIGVDDEDGVVFGPLTAGLDGAITVTVTGTGGKLNAWIDWNNDGDFGLGDQVGVDLAMSAGANQLTIAVPIDAFPGANLAARFRLSSAGSDAAATGTAADGEIEDYVVVVGPPGSGCTTTTFTMTGDSSTDGTDGNVRSFSADGVIVKATAFSRTTAGTWAPAYLGAFSYGLGVTDTSETGDSGSHTVDNYGRWNYVLFEFSTPVVVDRAYLGYVSNDSDLRAWIGTFTDPYQNHLTLSDSVLAGCELTEDSTGGSSARWADLNAGDVAGNVLVIAALPGESNDYFKIKELTVCVPTPPSYDYGDLPVAGTTFNTDGVGTSTIAVDTSSAGTTGTGTTASTLTIAHATGTGTGRLMLVGVAVGNTSSTVQNVSSVTYGGTDLTFVGRVMAPTGGGGTSSIYSRPQTEIWALANPPSGSANVLVTLTGSRAFSAGVTTFSGVDVSNGLTSALGTFGSNAASSGRTATVNLGTTLAQMVYDVVASANYGSSDPSIFTASDGRTQQWTRYARSGSSTAVRLRSAASTGLATGTSSVVAETSTTSYPWAVGAVPINPQTLITAPRHIIAGSLALGMRRDTEPNGQPTANADGDDLNGTVDDEDGVQFGPLITGQMGAITVATTVAGGSLNAWVDWNNDGSFGTGEQVASNFPLEAGVNPLPVAVPSGAAVASPVAARFRLSSAGNDAATTGTAADGEIEDYVVQVISGSALDFGDAPLATQSLLPASYPTTSANRGAFHVIVPGFCLGEQADSENDGQPSKGAVDDDEAGYPWDEDGVVFTSRVSGLLGAATVRVTLLNTAGRADPQLDAWIDFNQDGDWDDDGERIFTGEPLVTGPNNLTFTVPSGIVSGHTYARFRLSDGGIESPTGPATSGEVEDWIVYVTTSDAPLYSVGNRVWMDIAPTDAQLDPTESGIANVILELKDSFGAIVDTTTTDYAGYYRFDYIPAGYDYRVFITLENFLPGAPLSGLSTSTHARQGTVAGVISDPFSLAPGGQPVGEPDIGWVGRPGRAGLMSDPPQTPSNPPQGNYPEGDAFDNLDVDFAFYPTPPTAATLAYFRALQSPAHAVILQWGTLVESDLIGFQLERATAPGAWVAVVDSVIPAHGDGYCPQAYEAIDSQAAALGVTRYRLLGVSLRGTAKVLAEAALSPTPTLRAALSQGSFQIEFRGASDAAVILETTTDPVHGPWEIIETLILDASGFGTLTRTLDAGEAMRFFRVRE